MASVHPSRARLVPQSDSSDKASDERERELRQRLYQQRENRAAALKRDDREGDQIDSYHQRRVSPSYEAYGSQNNNERNPAETSYRSRQRYFDDRQHDRNDGAFLDRQGAPPPGAWGRRDHDQSGEKGPMGDNFLQSRQEQRKASTFSIWPPSPTSPYRESKDEDIEKRKKSSSRHKDSSHRHTKRRSHHSSRHRSDYIDSEEEEEYRRRRRKKDVEHERSSRHRSSSPSRHRKHKNDSEDEYEREKRLRREKEYRRRGREDRSAERSDDEYRKSCRRRTESRRSEKEPTSEIKGNETKFTERSDTPDKVANDELKSVHSLSRKIGPQLPHPDSEMDSASPETINARAYGKALLPGEGSAMANFVQEGKRIPRRGEIGLSSDQIEAYENAGFVMSGSRHNRMNAVRMRKENQIYTAEEQRSMLKLIAEEKQKKEAALVEQFKEMVDSIDND